MKNRLHAIFGVFCLTQILLVQCVSFSTYQTPEPVAPDETAFGGGISGVVADSSAGFGGVELYARHGLGPNMDAGIKLGGMPGLYYLLMGDVKFRLAANPLTVSADVGMSISAGSDRTATLAWYPTVLVGTSTLYGGLKAVLIRGTFEGDAFAVDHPLTGLVVGTRFGHRFRVLPEINCYFSRQSSPLFFGGIGLQFNFQ